MVRPTGTRSPDFERKRDALLTLLADRLGAPDGHVAGMRALAEAAGVTYPTLRHYFGSRSGILMALFEKRFAEGRPYLSQMAHTPLPFAQSIAEAVAFVMGAASQPEFMTMHEIGLREGLNTKGIGSGYLGAIFEPTLRAIEARLQHHMAQGEMRQVDARTAALVLLSPLLLGALHQHSLEGAAFRPLSMQDFADQLTDTFVRAYGSPLNAPNLPQA